MATKKKNRYLWLFIMGVLILIIPQIRILVNEFRTAYHISAYQTLINHYSTDQLDGLMNQMATFDSSNETYHDPFAYEVAPTETTYLDENTPTESAAEIMGYIEIPKIGERLPIYNGATNDHLSLGAAMVTGTSLPIGGPSTHSVISAHRGYAGANFFRYIDLLEPGDQFTITVLNDVLIYEVIETTIISPNDASRLGIVAGEDLVTLLSCHPYRVNDQRILVFAKRVPNNQARILSHYSTLLASTKNGYTGTQTLHSARTMGWEDILSILFKFTDVTLDQSVRKDILFNRLTILAGLVAIIQALGKIVGNIRKEGKLDKQQRYADDFL